MLIFNLQLSFQIHQGLSTQLYDFTVTMFVSLEEVYRSRKQNTVKGIVSAASFLP